MIGIDGYCDGSYVISFTLKMTNGYSIQFGFGDKSTWIAWNWDYYDSFDFCGVSSTILILPVIWRLLN